MDALLITQCFRELAAELDRESIKGEVCLYGGAVMCLVYQARPATKDVDAIFEPSSRLRTAAKRVAERHGLPDDWLNDAVKGYVVPHERRVLWTFPGLVVYVPDSRYLLAMKCLAGRADTADRDDAALLIRELGMQRPEEVFELVRHYYPQERLKPATRFFIEEIMQQP